MLTTAHARLGGDGFVLRPSIENVRLKLSRLADQIEVVLGSEFPNNDSRAGVLALQSVLPQAEELLESYDQVDDDLKIAILSEVNLKIADLTNLLGFMVRSTTNRNLFELCYPLKKIACKLVEREAKLILSSDWNYVPFTLPFGLTDLPNYVLIGLPAPESENALVFPIAGHELGHNIWAAQKGKEHFISLIIDGMKEIITADRTQLEQVYPDLKDIDILNRTEAGPFLQRIIDGCCAQAEEFFCDFIGLILFGKSYIYALDYLVAPISKGTREVSYPSDIARIKHLERFSDRLSIPVRDLQPRFTDQAKPENQSEAYDVLACDCIVDKLTEKLFDFASKLIADACCPSVNDADAIFAARCFRAGFPATRTVNFGDLFNAAWDVYCNPDEASGLPEMGQTLVAFLTDLVIKSAELAEFEDVSC